MTNIEELSGMWVDSELKKIIETKRNIIGGLDVYLKNLYKTDLKMFQRIVDLGLITDEEKKEAMTD